MKVLIVGGGIGGLSAAMALDGTGHQVSLVEQATAFTGVGAGIVLAANATRALGELGVDALSKWQPLGFMDICGPDGATLQRMEVRETVGVTRAGLHAALAAALPRTVEVELGREVVDVLERPDGVEVRFSGSGTGQRFDLIIGADGLHSKTRSTIVGPVALRYSGVTCFRGVVQAPSAQAPLAGLLEAWGVGSRVGVVPVEGGQVYFYLVQSAEARAAAPSWPQGFRRVFAGYGGVTGALLAQLWEMPGMPSLHHDLNELDTPVWGKGRVLLLGDAAHGMTPNLGQGAAMAIEDALGLAVVLADGAEGALERYVELRHQRVRQVQLDSRRIGAIAHWQSPAARGLRDAVMRLVPSSAGRAQSLRLLTPGVELAARYRELKARGSKAA